MRSQRSKRPLWFKFKLVSTYVTINYIFELKPERIPERSEISDNYIMSSYKTKPRN